MTTLDSDGIKKGTMKDTAVIALIVLVIIMAVAGGVLPILAYFGVLAE